MSIRPSIRAAALTLLPLLILFASTALAAPVVSSVSAPICPGATLTVSGSGFGAAGPSIVVFDDFESGSEGAPIAIKASTVGGWSSIEGDAVTRPRYSSQYARSGQLAALVNFEGSVGNGVRGMNAAISSTDVFYSYWVYLPKTSTYPGINNPSGPNWKITWVFDTCSGGGCGGLGDLFVVTLPKTDTDPNTTWYLSGNVSSLHKWFGFSFYKGVWNRIWGYYHGSGAAGASLADLRMMERGKPVQHVVDSFQSTLAPGFLRFTNACVGCWGRGTPQECRPRFDDVYVATGPAARARVELGNAKTYSACTELDLLTTTAWSGGSIKATYRAGGMAPGPAYLFVIDATGAVSAGHPVSVGSCQPGGDGGGSDGGGDRGSAGADRSGQPLETGAGRDLAREATTGDASGQADRAAVAPGSQGCGCTSGPDSQPAGLLLLMFLAAVLALSATRPR